MKQPCSRDCEGRDATCHATCEKWLEFEVYKAECFEKKKKYREENEYFIKKASIIKGKYLRENSDRFYI